MYTSTPFFTISLEIFFLIIFNISNASDVDVQLFTSTASLKLLSVVMMEERDESEADEIVFVVRVVGLRRDMN